jgi:hypothetical protein
LTSSRSPAAQATPHRRVVFEGWTSTSQPVERLCRGYQRLTTNNRLDQLVGQDFSVSVAQLTKVAGLVDDRHPSQRLDAPGPRHVGQVVEPLTRPGRVPVDERHRPALLADGVERAGIAVNDALVAERPRMPGGRVMQPPQHPSGLPVRAGGSLAGMICRLTWDVGQDVAAMLVDAQVPRCVGKASRLEVAQQARDLLRAMPASAAHCLADPYDVLGVVPAPQQ